MPKNLIIIDCQSREYWASEFRKYLDECSIPQVGRMPTGQRRAFTRVNGKLRGNDLAARTLLVDQARLALEEEGFTQDEIECCLKTAPTSGGEAPVPLIDKLAAHYLYPRMTGQELREERTYRRNTLPVWQMPHAGTPFGPDTLRGAIGPLTPSALQTLESDKRHQLNTMQAKKLLRKLLGISQNTLGKILNK